MRRSGTVGLVLLTALGLSSCGSRRPAQQQSQQQQPGIVVDPPSTPPNGAATATASQATMTWDDKPRDPCAQQYFDENLCQHAIQNRGYHYGGAWIPMVYSLGYPSYFGAHRTYISSGGSYSATPVHVYEPSFKAPAAGTVVRGGFGTTASAMHASSGSSSGGSFHSSGASSSSSAGS